MLFVRVFTSQEEGELSRRLKHATKTRVYLRLKTVELSHQGKPVQEIATLLGRHPNSIRSYIHRFNQGGFASLMPRWGGGASQKLRDLDKAYFDDVLSRPPAHFEQLETHVQNWTYPLVQQYLLKYEGREVSQSTIWYHLRRCKYTSGRSKLSVTSPDPAYQVKRERVETLEKKASKGA
jgi:transposase